MKGSELAAPHKAGLGESGEGCSSAFPPLSPRHPPSLWVFLSPLLSPPALLSASPCRLSQPALVLLFLFLPFSPPSCSTQPSFGDTVPLGRGRGKKHFDGPLSCSLSFGGPLFSSKETPQILDRMYPCSQ
ncbi:unnamed protein product [Rangifer tarandus platyrhynchus]|uniref:Uncharacterized protein n=2 Tax=Rangifer tarandus platyrhynchus TaxID=3082113 RepID=A0AC59Y0J8_RANTA|nr:unnamed protein product [Rangifer tarandus platyrhynchus]